MGDSEKLGGVDNSDYSFDGHYSFLDAFLTKLDLGEKVNLVIHDWGCGLGLKFARMHPEIISSITFMEGVTVPLKWEQWPEAGTKIFKFPSEADADNWWADEGYQELSKHRRAATNSTIQRVKGLPPRS